MIDISTLRAGDIVRNLGSGNAYEVQKDAECMQYWRATLKDGIECSNPQEWEVLARGPWTTLPHVGAAITAEVSSEPRSITWGQGDDSRTVYAPTWQECVLMMNAICFEDQQRLLGLT